MRSLPGAAENCLPVIFPTAPVPSANGPQLGSWRVAVVQVEETPAGDASGPECPRARTNRQQPIDMPEVAEKTLEPLEHMVHTQTDPAGQFSDVGTLSSSDCYPVGPVGPYVAGGPVGPDVYNTDPNSLTHMVWIPPDPDGQDSAPTGTPSPSDRYPAGPYVAGGIRPADWCVAVRSLPAARKPVRLDWQLALSSRQERTCL